MHTPENMRRQKTRNWVVFGLLMSFVILIFFITIAKMSLNTP